MRCYCDTYQATHTSYIGCSVDPEWHNYQKFAKWWNENYYMIPGERMDFDKDLLFKGNRVYAPEKCCIIPHRLNLLFMRRIRKEKSTPTGILKTASGKFYATYGAIGKTNSRVGPFDTLEDAFARYKEIKESAIRAIVEQYKDKIPECVYNAALNWRVEITD